MITWGSARRETIGRRLFANAENDPDRIVHECDGRQISHGELLSSAVAYANAYSDFGVGPGDVVATFMENRVEHSFSWGACSLLGSGHLPCNTFLRGDFLRHQLGKGEAEVAVVDPGLVDRVLAISEELPSLRHLVLRGTAEEAAAVSGPLPVTSTEEILAGDSGKLHFDRQPRHDDLNAIIFTGGTTGPSKGVAMSQSYVVAMLETTRRCNGWTPSSIYYQPLPLFHINALGLTVIQPVLFGGKGVTASALSITEFWNEVRRHRATHLSLFGPLYLMLWGLPPQDSDSDNPAQVSVGYCPVDIHEGFERRFGLRIYSSYALSEAIMVAHSTPDDLPPPGRAGRPNPDYEVRLLDDNDEEVPVGEVGEICVRPRRPYVMFSGYHNDPAGTASAFRNLWFHTGDLGSFDADGYLAFVDRKADYLRRRGENISTYEVEQVIIRFPAVAEVAVHGVPSEVGEEEVKATVRLRPGATLDHRELLDHCASRMPYYAVPRYIEVVDDLPRSPIGRVQKFELKEAGITPGTFDRASIGYEVSK